MCVPSTRPADGGRALATGLHELTVFRPNDLVALTFRFVNFELTGAAGDQRLAPMAGETGFLIVTFPLQCFGEEAYPEQSPFNGGSPGAPLDRTGDVAVRAARPSRLVFRVTEGEPEIPFTLEGLLEVCRSRPMSLAGDPSRFPEPAANHTALEMPYGLILSPRPEAGWHHSVRPATTGNRTELWNTRLGRLGGLERERHPVPGVRAVWPGADTITRRDPQGRKIGQDFTTSLDDAERGALVAYGRHGLPDLQVDRLMLTQLGAWLDANGSWPDPDPALGSLAGLTYRMTLGRDQYVRTVQAGFLFPFGHRAVRVKITERKVQRNEGGTVAGYLRQRVFLVVQEFERSYDRRSFPFTKVTVMTRVTPDLAPPGTSPINGQSDHAFWPMLDATRDVLFRVVAEDRRGAAGSVEFVTPMAFVADDTEGREALSVLTGTEMQQESNKARMARPMNGRQVMFAEPHDRSDSTFEADKIHFSADLIGASPPFEPTMTAAEARVPAVRNITGGEAPVRFSYHPAYLDPVGNPTNPLDAFAKVEVPPAVGFTPEQAGGLSTLSLTVNALSRTFGPLAGQSGDTGVFNPAAVFGEGPKLLGTFRLDQLLDPTPPPFTSPEHAFPREAGSQPAVPRIVADAPDASRFHWSTRAFKPVPEVAEIVDASAAALTLDVHRRPSPDGSVSLTSHGVLENFSVTLPGASFPLIRVPFASLEFLSEAGRKTDVSVKLGTIDFLGPLGFVKKLAALIPAGGFEDPPALEVTAEGITAGYSLAVPSLTFGVFNLQQLSLLAAVHVPLALPGTNGAGRASLRLAFSEREHPCLLTVSAFGGAAFLGLDVGFGGLNVMEGSLEFGGALALNIGVASGGVTVMAGVYYAYVAGQSDSLSAFVRVNGVLEILGIVSISAQFLLTLTYTAPKLSGSASLKVKVKVLFVSKSVSMTVTREFAGSPAPTFADAMSPEDWAAYVDAFAPDQKEA